MADIARFGVSIDSQLVRKFDALISRKGYTTRSEAIRDMIRDMLVDQEWESGKQETVGTITIVYNHHTRELHLGIQLRVHHPTDDWRLGEQRHLHEWGRLCEIFRERHPDPQGLGGDADVLGVDKDHDEHVDSRDR